MGLGSTIVPETVRESYLRKFTLAVVGMVIVGLILSGVITVVVSGMLSSQAKANVQGTANLSADAAQTWMQGNEQSTRMVSNYNELTGWKPNGSTVHLYRSLNDEVNANPTIVDAHFVTLSSDGRATVEVSTDSNVTGENASELGIEWTSGTGRVVLLTHNTVLTSKVYRRDGVPRIAFVSGISTEGKRSTAVILVANASTIDFQRAAEGSFTQAVGSDGVVELASDPGEVGTHYDSGGGTNATAIGGVTERNGYVVASTKIDGTPWTVLSHVPKSNVYQLRTTVVAMMGGVVVVFLLGFVFVGGTIGRSTVTSLTTLTAKAERLRDGDLDVDIEDATDREDELGTLYTAFAEMRNALERRIKEAEVARSEAVEMNDYLETKADEYAETLQQAAAGDLTARLEQDGESEPMDRIASEFNETISELEKTTGQLKSFADEVETAGLEVQQSADTVRDASEEVAGSIQRVSDDAYDQRERLRTVSETMDEIATDLETFAADNPEVDFGESLDRIEEVATMLNEVSDLSEETMAEAENVAGAAEEQAAELNQVSERANDLSRYASPLQEVLDRFETQSEHEFYFPTGPGNEDSGASTQD